MAVACAVYISGCASMPDMADGGLPLGKSGWQMSGGLDFDKQCYFVMFWKPWGANEKALGKALLP